MILGALPQQVLARASVRICAVELWSLPPSTIRFRCFSGLPSRPTAYPPIPLNSLRVLTVATRTPTSAPASALRPRPCNSWTPPRANTCPCAGVTRFPAIRLVFIAREARSVHYVTSAGRGDLAKRDDVPAQRSDCGKDSKRVGVDQQEVACAFGVGFKYSGLPAQSGECSTGWTQNARSGV